MSGAGGRSTSGVPMLRLLAGAHAVATPFLVALSVSGDIASANELTAQRAWTAHDSIAVRYIVVSGEYPGTLQDGTGKELIEWSPDGSRFFFVARRGEVDCDCNVYTLFVHATEDLKRVPPAYSARASRTVELASSRSDPWYQGIVQPRWESDDSILLLGVRGSDPRQVYRLDLSSGALTALTHSASDVWTYSAHGDSIVYSTLRKVPNRDLNTYPVVAVDADQVIQLAGVDKQLLDLSVSYRGSPARSIAESFHLVAGPWIAPGGKHALVAGLTDGEPLSGDWETYEVRPSKYWRTTGRFLLIDLQSGAMTPVLDAPTGKATRAGWPSDPEVLWSSDGRRAILINTALPITSAEEDRKNTSYIVELDAVTGDWAIVEALVPAPRNAGTPKETVSTVSGADWVRRDEAFRVKRTTWEGPGPPSISTTVYSRSGTGWRARAGGSLKKQDPDRSEVAVVVRQSADDPPMPVATYRGREVPLLQPDPALNGIWRAPVRRVEWREKDGRTIAGGLMLPREVSAPPPLVIQAYHYQPGLFRPDGSAPTAYAAQLLVSAGIAVLDLDIPAVDRDADWRRKVSGTVHEGVSFVERIDAAVAALASQNLIDPAKVGLVGFSRGGFMAYYAITHPGETPLQAAVVADAYSGSYGAYVADAATAPFWTTGDGGYETYYGGGTFWQNKAAWLEHTPGFNVDRVTTPTLFTAHEVSTNLFSLETLGAFRINRRPFEYWTFGVGSHQLQRPKERIVSIEGSVDWMRFWLLHAQSDEPQKARQYERWRKIRSDWEKQRAKGEHDGRVSQGQPRPTG